MCARFTCRALLLSGLIVLAGCSPNQTPAKADFRATDTAGRVPAIVDAADQDDPATLGELIYALGDDDPAVRLFAIQSLRTRTGRQFGYRYYDPPDHRRAAASRWAAWLDRQGNAATPEADAHATPPMIP